MKFHPKKVEFQLVPKCFSFFWSRLDPTTPGFDYFHKQLASETLGLVVLFSDGYLDIKPDLNTTVSTKPSPKDFIRRFLSIMKKLPLVFQEKIIFHLYPWAKKVEISDRLFQKLLESQKL